MLIWARAQDARTPCGRGRKTKPVCLAVAVCSVPARASEETPCGVTTNGGQFAKQSQFERSRLEAGGGRQEGITGVVRNKPNSRSQRTKQSQFGADQKKVKSSSEKGLYALGLVGALPIVISTGGPPPRTVAEKSGCERYMRPIPGQMSRLRCAPLDMTGRA